MDRYPVAANGTGFLLPRQRLIHELLRCPWINQWCGLKLQKVRGGAGPYLHNRYGVTYVG